MLLKWGKFLFLEKDKHITRKSIILIKKMKENCVRVLWCISRERWHNLACQRWPSFKNLYVKLQWMLVHETLIIEEEL